MKNHYYIEYTRDFANTYNLFHAPADFTPPDNWGWERISRKEAESKACEERRRRREDPAFSGFAATYILPHDLGELEDCFDHRRFAIDGVIIVRRK